MKKIVASVGLVALGASSLQAASLAGFSADSPKPWSIALTLRGFYDDNVNSVADNQEDSFGFEISPSLGFNWQLERTTISLAYVYSLKWYEDPPAANVDDYDQTHAFNLAIDHALNQQFSLSVRDSFVIGQEPDTLRAGNAFTTFQRLSGDNIRNYGAITLNAQLSRVFGMEVGYANSFFDYDQDGELINGDFGNGFFIGPSASGLLDRQEHIAHVDARWQLQPDTVGLVGYQYRAVNYSGDEFISGDVILDPITLQPIAIANGLKSDVRDSRSHYVYLGADHTFRPDFTGSLRAGARFTDYFNDPNSDETDIAPYVMASLRYVYMLDSTIEAGASYDQNATDQFSVDENDNITQSAQSVALWASVNHRFTPHIYGSLVGQYQHSTFHGGSLDDESDQYFLAGVNLEYRFNTHFSAHVGYNYDRLDSDVGGRDFDRNRVYIGFTAGY